MMLHQVQILMIAATMIMASSSFFFSANAYNVETFPTTWGARSAKLPNLISNAYNYLPKSVLNNKEERPPIPISITNKDDKDGDHLFIIPINVTPNSNCMKEDSLATPGLLEHKNNIRFQQDHPNLWNGCRTNLCNAFMSTVIPLLFRYGRIAADGSSSLSNLVMTIGYAGLVYDNVVIASGKFLGEGILLRRLSKVRNILHGWTIPSLYLPIIETCKKSGIFSTQASKIAMAIVVLFGLYEVIDWISFDINDMILVDKRNSLEHSANAIAGTLSYSSGKVLKCILPIIILNVVLLMVGSTLWLSRGVPGGRWMVASACLLVGLSCQPSRPDIIAYGEPLMMSLLWAASSSILG